MSARKSKKIPRFGGKHAGSPFARAVGFEGRGNRNVFSLHGEQRQFYKITLKDFAIEKEIRRFRRRFGLPDGN
jgi:hypothetical protein